MIVVLGVLCGGAWWVRAIRHDARQPPSPVSARAPDNASQDNASSDNASSDNASSGNASQDNAAIENVVPQPPSTPSLDSASAPPHPATSPRQKRGSGDSEAETKLVLTAGAALVRDDAGAALALTRQHLAQFPNGAHAEERDRIAIEALARLGGIDDARAAAGRFFIRYPQSIYRSRIETLLR
jgi:hypothetical protein